MTLRLGQTPVGLVSHVGTLLANCYVCATNFLCMQSEAVVNGGPAVFISPNGPNHIMVQVVLVPLSFLS